MELFTNEKMSYHHRRSTASAAPNRYCSLIFDRPSNWFIPHIVSVASGFANLQTVPIPVVGVINHSCQHRYIFLYPPSLQDNANTIMTSVFLALYLCRKQHHHHCCPIAYFQADNCYRENKNRWFFGFIHYLISIGWFHEVLYSMMVPGHTHEDVDAMFGNISHSMDSNSASTLPALEALIQHTFIRDSTRPTTVSLSWCLDWISFLAACVKDIAYHSASHVFLSRMLPDGTVGLKYRIWHHNDPPYIGDPEKPDVWLKILSHLPTGFPQVLKAPQLSSELLKDIHSFFPWMTDKSVDVQ